MDDSMWAMSLALDAYNSSRWFTIRRKMQRKEKIKKLVFDNLFKDVKNPCRFLTKID
jgi:hypothetical protein